MSGRRGQWVKIDPKETLIVPAADSASEFGQRLIQEYKRRAEGLMRAEKRLTRMPILAVQ